MEQNFTPLNNHPPQPHHARPRKKNVKLLGVLFSLIVLAGAVGGYFMMSGTLTLQNLATGSGGGEYNPCDYIDCSGPEPTPRPLACGESCRTGNNLCVSGTTCVSNGDGTRRGTCVLVACSQDASKCDTSRCKLLPSATPTKAPSPTPTVTPNPVCGGPCTTDGQCPADHKCVDPTTMTSTGTGPKKCVLTKCTELGVVCTPNKCTVVPPTPTNACPKPNPVKNLRINCPICKQS